MKQIITLIALVLSTAAISQTKQPYTIQGSAKGFSDGTFVILEKQTDQKIQSLDSVKVIKEKFLFKGVSQEPEVYMLQVKNFEGKLAFILENGNIQIAINKNDLAKSTIGGTYNNDQLQLFNAKTQELNQKMLDYQKANTEVMKEAQIKGDKVAIDKIMADFEILRSEMVSFSTNYPSKNPKSYISLLIIDNLFNQPTVDIKKIRQEFSNLDQQVKKTSQGLKLKQKIDDFKMIEVGEVAPNFEAPNPEGNIISLKQSLGKVTLIDFWASWCGPCRKENPHVVAMYNELHTKGFNIIGVSLDRDKTKWIEAIAKDQLAWPQISNLKSWEEPIAVMYGVKSIPFTVVLDKDGKIAALNLRGEELKAKIIELLK